MVHLAENKNSNHMSNKSKSRKRKYKMFIKYLAIRLVSKNILELTVKIAKNKILPNFAPGNTVCGKPNELIQGGEMNIPVIPYSFKEI